VCGDIINKFINGIKKGPLLSVYSRCETLLNFWFNQNFSLIKI
jgi:hypothetical protein